MITLVVSGKHAIEAWVSSSGWSFLSLAQMPISCWSLLWHESACTLGGDHSPQKRRRPHRMRGLTGSPRRRTCSGHLLPGRDSISPHVKEGLPPQTLWELTLTFMSVSFSFISLKPVGTRRGQETEQAWVADDSGQTHQQPVPFTWGAALTEHACDPFACTDGGFARGWIWDGSHFDR